jgi:hypothetical protein
MGLSGLGGGAALDSRAAIGDRSESPCRLMALDIRAFGAAGDGGADDTPAFGELHKAMRRAQQIDDTARVAAEHDNNVRALDPCRNAQERFGGG